jgi:hypothetical protein
VVQRIIPEPRFTTVCINGDRPNYSVHTFGLGKLTVVFRGSNCSSTRLLQWLSLLPAHPLSPWGPFHH